MQADYKQGRKLNQLVVFRRGSSGLVTCYLTRKGLNSKSYGLIYSAPVLQPLVLLLLLLLLLLPGE